MRLAPESPANEITDQYTMLHASTVLTGAVSIIALRYQSRPSAGCNWMELASNGIRSNDTKDFCNHGLLPPAASRYEPKLTVSFHHPTAVAGRRPLFCAKSKSAKPRSTIGEGHTKSRGQDRTTTIRCGEWDILCQRRADCRKNGARNLGGSVYLEPSAATDQVLRVCQGAVGCCGCPLPMRVLKPSPQVLANSL
jgi:hypothetical protein